jgi:hypothetical protein
MVGGRRPSRYRPTSGVKKRLPAEAGMQSLRDKMKLEINPYRARTSPKPADYTHLSQLSVKYALFGLWQSSEDQGQSARVISF